MGIPFTQIPDILLVPGQYQEIDNSLAGAVTDVKRAIAVGIMGADGVATAGQPIAVSGEARGRVLAGAGTPAATMILEFLALNRVDQLWLLPLAENSSGVAATYTLTVTASSAKAGTLTRYIGGRRIQVGIANNDTDATIAAALVAAINADIDMEVDAAVNGTNPAIVDLTYRVKGEVGNGLTFTSGLAGETDPAGVSIAFAAAITGAGNPDLTGVFNALGDERYHYWITDLADQASLTAFGDELTSRYSALRQIGGRMFVEIGGDVGDATTAGSMIEQAQGVNNPHVVLVPRGNNPATAAAFVARYAAPVVRRLADDPAANTQGIEVPGLTVTHTYTFEERQRMLEAGIATWRTNGVGTVLIERVVTSYTENAEGNRDTSYLDIQVTETVDAVRTTINAIAAQRFRNWKLASTNENFGPGSRVMTTAGWSGFLVELYQQTFILERQWCQDLDAYKASLIVEIEAGSKVRINYQHRPVLIGQFLIAAGVNQFR